ncbi:peptidylprolyl isomerase [Maritimibacter sp. DP1N21-5]|uniref:SurA N-terminal domain-containing protein n=1 Tax=Maritimibacter sp. DP1N21-5 TaxID=2836867 RepID=UPI001C471F29|nr:peptidylprolyl isomerase [Maritimibacter sp. DP1N21-5]MBV7409507.1 peptidylprolyl isomerase [Maritimibacter sp. DP1N21-5]
MNQPIESGRVSTDEANRGPKGAGLFSVLSRGLRHGLVVGTVLLGGVATMSTPLFAQGQYAPVIKVNDDMITAYELSQRTAFLTLLRAPGDVRELAREQLINEKLQLAEAERLGVAVTEEQIAEGMLEFAARGNLDIEQMTEFLAQAGISFETFRDFTRAGILWREVARTRFLSAGQQITESEIDRAYAEAEPQPGVKLLLTEIILPASSPESEKASMLRAERLAQISDPAEFAEAATRFSVVGSRLAKGERDWMDILALPPEAQSALRNTTEGNTSRPVMIPELGVAVYYVRDRETITSTNVGTLLEYAAFLIPGGRTEATMAEAARIRTEVDICDDLYPIARGLPADQLVREELPEGSVPAAYRGELSKLDPGEVSTALTTSSGNALVFLMLCNRRNAVPDSVSRAQVADALRNQRVGALANDLLADLRAQARVEYF